MLTYFLLFTFIGVILGMLFNEDKSILIIICIAIIWGISHKFIWGFVSLGELFLGYYLSKYIKK